MTSTKYRCVAPREFDFADCQDPPSFIQRHARQHARRSRREQGLSPVITDPIAIERVAALLRGKP